MLKFKVSDDVSASFEGLVDRRPFPIFNGIVDIHKELIRQNPGLSSRYLISLYDYGPSKMLWGIFVKKGFLSKTYVFDEKLMITKEQYYALKRFYYDIHAYEPASIFNMLDVLVTHDSKKLDVSYNFGYNRDIDQASGASHAAGAINPAQLKITEGAHPFVTTGENLAGFKPLKF